MRTRQSYFLQEKIEASTEMEAAWKWATKEERQSIKEHVQATTKTSLSNEYRWYFQLLPRNPNANKHDAKDRVLSCIMGMPPTNRGMKRESILSLVGVPDITEAVKEFVRKRKLRKKTVTTVEKKKRKRRSTIIW